MHCIASTLRAHAADILYNSVTLIPGDGVGKEITQSVEEIFEVSSELFERDHHADLADIVSYVAPECSRRV